MACLNYENGKRHGWRLRTYAPGGKRHSLWLGEMPSREAEKIKRHVAAVIESQKCGTPMPGETLRWLDKIDAGLRTKLIPVLGNAKTVAQAIAGYVEWGSERHKKSTCRAAMHTLGQFGDCFGRRQMRSLCGDELDSWLATRNVCPNTVAKHAKNLKAFVAWAKLQGWVDDLRIATSSNIGAGKKQFVSLDEFDRLLAAITDHQVRCGLALSRWVGLRIPSELEIRRSHVDWQRMRLTIVDNKRTRRSGRGPPRTRVTPIFPELAPFIERVWSAEGAPEDYLLPDIATGTRFGNRIIATRDQLGMDWPRLFHSLRATRQTELIARFGMHAACEWIGNTASVASKFYMLVDDAIWTEATGV